MRRRIERAVAQYVVEIRVHEFRTLRAGHAAPRAQPLLANIHGIVQSYSPVTTAQQTSYSAANEELHTIVGERESRLDAAETSIPKPLLYLMIVLAVLTLAVTLLIVTHNRAVDVAIIVTVAIVISSGLFTAEILQYPFSGSIAVNRTIQQPCAGGAGEDVRIALLPGCRFGLLAEASTLRERPTTLPLWNEVHTRSFPSGVGRSLTGCPGPGSL